MIHDRELLCGYWCRTEILSDHQQVTEYALLLANGCYEFSFSLQNTQGELIEQSTEQGDWGLVGDIHFTIAKQEVCNSEVFMSDLTNADNYHAYKVLTLNRNIFKYQHIVTHEVFILNRVIDKINH